MSGPHSIDRETLGKRLKRRQFWSEAFAWLVGGGLLIEYGREIFDCFINWHAPSLPLIGGALVTLGVFGEVWFSRLTLNASEELQRRADSDVAQANERAAQALERANTAEQATKEAELELAQIRRRQEPRAATFQHDKFVTSLSAKPKGRVDLIMYPPDDGEAWELAIVLWMGLRDAGWDLPQQPIPIPPDLVGPNMPNMPAEEIAKLPPTVRVGGQPNGVTIVGNSFELHTRANPDTAFGALSNGILKALGEIKAGKVDLPNDVFWIVIGSKP